MLSLLVVAFVALFFRWFIKQHHMSMDKPEDWGHAYLIPLVSAGLVWLKREKIFKTTPTVFWPGLAPFVLGIVAYFFCVVGIPNHMLQGFSMILTIFGLVLLIMGPQMMRWLFLPIAYLGFGVTLSEMIMIKLTFQLQLMASQGAGAVLTVLGALFGFDTRIDGNTIYVTDSLGKVNPLNVAEACAGMRMVIAFIALAAAVALMRCKFWWQRIALVMLSIPVAVALNVARVAVLGLLTLKDPNLAAGDAHMLIGTLLLIPGFLLFLGVVWVLERIVKDDTDPAAKPGAKVKLKTQAAAKVRLHWPEWFARPVAWTSLARGWYIVPVVLLLLSAVGFGAGIRMAGIYLQKFPIQAPDNRSVRAIPNITASWEQIGQDRIEKAEVQESLGTENYVTRTFKERNPADPRNPGIIELHIAYYTGMIDTVPHVPDRCFIGGGMSILSSARLVPIPLNQSEWTLDQDVPESMKGHVYRAPAVNQHGAIIERVRLPRDPQSIELNVSRYKAPGTADRPEGMELTAGYFFIANGGTVARAERVRLLAFNLEDDYAYYMKVQVSSPLVKSAEELAALAGRLLDELLPEIMRCVPDWVKVERGEYPADNPRRKPDAGGGVAIIPGSPGGKDRK